MEIHTGATWKISTSFPFPLCSNGFLGEYGPECFLILVVILIYNGLACIFIFLYRMEVASKHTAPTMLYKITHFQTYLLYFLLVMLSGITVFMYPVLKEQLDYKQRLEMVKNNFFDWKNWFFFLRKSDRFQHLCCAIAVSLWFTTLLYS